jgi:hypothetical protein
MVTADLYKVRGIMGQAADALYRHYGPDLEGIQQASVSDLKRLKGVGDLSARCTHAFFHEPAYEFWYNENYRQDKWDDFRVLRGVFGGRITDILRANFQEADPVKILSVEGLQELGATSRQYGSVIRNVNITMSLREAQRVYDYFHLKACEFRSEY